MTGGRGHAGAQVGGGGQPQDGRRQGPRVGRNEQARLAIHHHLGQTAHVAGDQRPPRGHGLEGRQGGRLFDVLRMHGGHQHDVGQAVEIEDVVSTLAAQQADMILQPVLADDALHLLSLAALPGVEQQEAIALDLLHRGQGERG